MVKRVGILSNIWGLPGISWWAGLQVHASGYAGINMLHLKVSQITTQTTISRAFWQIELLPFVSHGQGGFCVTFLYEWVQGGSRL